MLHMHSGMRTRQARAEVGAEQDAPDLAGALAGSMQRRREAAQHTASACTFPFSTNNRQEPKCACQCPRRQHAVLPRGCATHRSVLKLCFIHVFFLASNDVCWPVPLRAACSAAAKLPQTSLQCNASKQHLLIRLNVKQ